jgi:hypothetical protein
MLLRAVGNIDHRTDSPAPVGMAGENSTILVLFRAKVRL